MKRAEPDEVRERTRIRVRKRVPREHARRIRNPVVRVVLWAIAVLAVFVLIGIAYATPALVRTSRDGRALLRQGRDAILRNDLEGARASFSKATTLFSSTETRVRSPLLWPLHVVPVASTNLAVLRTVASTGRQIGDSGFALASAVQHLPHGQVRIVRGALPLQAIAAAGDALDAGASAAIDIGDEVDRMPNGWVIGPLARARREVRELLPGASAAVTKAQAALHGLPTILGSRTPKRYLIAFSNLSELRGSGGLLGYVTELDAFRGHLRLGKLSGRPNDLFGQPSKLAFPAWFPDNLRTQAHYLQNINMTTDFPTTGDLLLQAMRAKAGRFDGVIALDPDGVAAVLRMTGPVRVGSWPATITAANVSKIMQHDVYLRIADRQKRDRFFGDVVHATFQRLVGSNVPLRPHDVGAFDATVQGGHFRMYSSDVRDEATFKIIGVAGNVDRARGASDAVSVVGENATANKGDWFLTRTLRYHADLDPAKNRASTTLRVDTTNTAPASGLPDYVIGGHVAGVPRGTNRQIFTVVRSARDDLEELAVGGERRNVLGTSEGSLRRYWTSLDVPAHSTRTVTVRSTVSGAFFGPPNERTFRLHVMPQAVAHPDAYDVSFGVGRGWTVVGATRVQGRLTGDLVLDVRVRQTRRGWLVHALLAPVRFVRGVLGS